MKASPPTRRSSDRMACITAATSAPRGEAPAHSLRSASNAVRAIIACASVAKSKPRECCTRGGRAVVPASLPVFLFFDAVADFRFHVSSRQPSAIRFAGTKRACLDGPRRWCSKNGVVMVWTPNPPHRDTLGGLPNLGDHPHCA